MLSGGPVSWKSHLQPIVALSSTEAEYITVTAAAQEGIWLRRVMSELGFEQLGATGLAVDNEGAIALSENPQAHPAQNIFDFIIISFDNMYRRESLNHTMSQPMTTSPISSQRTYQRIGFWSFGGSWV